MKNRKSRVVNNENKPSKGKFREYNPLAKPMLSGWKRKIRNKSVTYKSPCGIDFLKMPKLFMFLFDTRSPLNVDNFSFDSLVNCMRKNKNLRITVPDLSYGKENLPIPVIASSDRSFLPHFEYSTTLTPTSGIDLNLDPGFLCGCDCEDGCLDKQKCQCCQLTANGDELHKPDMPIDNIGYVYKRLIHPVPSGIFECNSRCKCAKSCLNRVVQHGLDMKLEVFKTTDERGWGVRCVNDVPEGAFICAIAGDLLTNKNANKGDSQYMINLDLVEFAEKTRINNEVEFIGKWSQNNLSDSEQSPYDTRSKNYIRKIKDEVSYSFKSVRKYYGGNKECFVLEAKNIARYFNHSCEPNLFVQNVLIDTHDLRFPRVALFASHYIKARTELTWDYNYQPGSVPDKELICRCGTKSCRGRLL